MEAADNRHLYATKPGVIHSFANGRIEDTGPLTRKRMETIDDNLPCFLAPIRFIEQSNGQGQPFFVWWNGTRVVILM